MNLVRSGDSREISASGMVSASPEKVFTFLGDLENHWMLADRFVEVLNLDAATGGIANGGMVRVRGPLGLGRTATTRVVAREEARSMTGTADLSGGTQALVRWTLTPERGATRVELTAEIRKARPLDRLLLAMGGRRWIRHRFKAILQTLERAMGPAPL